MLVKKAVQLAVLTIAALLWEAQTEAASTIKFRLCGRKLSEVMSRICSAYNKPTWEVPTVIEHPVNVARRRRDADEQGIADLCCNSKCTEQDLYAYCSIPSSENLLGNLMGHMIADRSAEKEQPQVVSAPAQVARSKRREVGRSLGYGRVRGRRCWCRRKRRSGRRRATLMGNMVLRGGRNAPRAAPILGTVSPLLTWGRTLNTDLPNVGKDRYAYVAVYNA